MVWLVFLFTVRFRLTCGMYPVCRRLELRVDEADSMAGVQQIVRTLRPEWDGKELRVKVCEHKHQTSGFC